MASISYANKEISVKIVYYGPGMSGKTSNLKLIYDTVLPEHKSKMVSIATENERTLFFDFLPLDLGRIKGFNVKLQLYTVPGQVYYNATRKLVLRGVDGVVFVADSSPEKINENVESFINLEENLMAYKYKLENIPLVIQYNKRDMPNAVPIEVLQKHINKLDYKWTEAVANKGTGVFDTLKLISVKVIEDINRKYLQCFRRQPSPSRPIEPQSGAEAQGEIKQPSVQTNDVRSDSQMPR